MAQETQYPVTIKAKYFFRILKGEYNPFTPTKFILDEDFIEIKKRNWHMISVDTDNFHWEDLNSISVDKHLFGASLIINRDKKNPHDGFSKRQANKIAELIKPKIHSTSQKGVADQIAGAIKDAVGTNQGGGSVSVADELKKMKDLLDQGILTQEEFDAQKQKLMG